MSLAAAIAAAGSLETKRKLFELKHGEWVTCQDAVDAKIISRSSAGINFKQLVDVGFMECDSSGNAHKYRAIAPIDTPLHLEMFIDESHAKAYYDYIQVNEVKKRTYSHNGARSIAYKYKIKILDMQKHMSSKPESAQDISLRMKIPNATVKKMLNELFQAGGCTRDYVRGGKFNRFINIYYLTKDSKTFDIGDPVTYTPHSDSRDGWKPSKMPTDNPMINALMGYTQFKPPKGRVIEESMPHIPVSKHRVYVAGSTLEMI
jgi:predicted transcriptional regulator